MENKKEPLMSSEEWYDSETEQGYVFMDMFDFATQYSDQILSQRIDELAERIAEKTQRVDIQGHGICDVIDKSSILKIANDFKNELNLNK